VQETDGAGKVLAAFPAIALIQRNKYAHLVMAEAIDMQLLQKKRSIINDELPYFLLP
jgi:hypothetical protein